VLEAADVRVGRGRPVLQGVSLKLKPGRIIVVIGPNGAGKSTVLACCSGALTLAHGMIRLAGAGLQPLSAAARRRGGALYWNNPPSPCRVHGERAGGVGNPPPGGAPAGPAPGGSGRHSGGPGGPWPSED